MAMHKRVCLVLVLLGATAIEPAGPPPPPGMGELLGELRVVKEESHLKELIGSPVVSLIMFTEGEEETNESKWFMLFSIMVESSINEAAGDARVNWAMVRNGAFYVPEKAFRNHALAPDSPSDFVPRMTAG